MPCYAILMIGNDARPFAADLFELLEETAVFLNRTDWQAAKALQKVLDNRQDYESGTRSLNDFQPFISHVTDYLVADEHATLDTPVDISLQLAADEDEALQQHLRALFIEQQQDGPSLSRHEIAQAAKAWEPDADDEDDDLPRSNLYIDIPPTLH